MVSLHYISKYDAAQRGTGIFPGRGRTTWRDWYTHAVVNANVGTNTTLEAPLSHINVHIRDGSAILLHSQPGYTITETQASPYTLLISLSTDGYASGNAYFDDGETIPPTPNRTAEFHVKSGSLRISSVGTFHVGPKLENVTVLGAQKPSKGVTANGKAVKQWKYTQQKELLISELEVDLNSDVTIEWE